MNIKSSKSQDVFIIFSNDVDGYTITSVKNAENRDKMWQNFNNNNKNNFTSGLLYNS